MCECLEYADGSIFLCTVCAGIWKEIEEEKEKQQICLHQFVLIPKTELLFCTLCGKIENPQAEETILV